MAETLENQILHALGQVFDHDKDKNIVSLGIVKNINVEAGKLISAYEHVLDKECLIGGETKSTYVLKKIIEQELTSRN